MVFAVQCPNPKCRKYMLVEDKDLGTVVQCLICKTTIRLASSKEKAVTPKPPANPSTE